ANWGAYLRDSWQIRPNLTFNYGLRYEQQSLRFAKYLQKEIDPVTNKAYGENAMSLSNMWAPRVGLLYDWTREGRAQIHAHRGRFYESIPMDINSRSFGGEVNYRTQFAAANCGAPPDPGYGGPSGTGCDLTMPANQSLIGQNGSLVAPGIKPQYMDE